MIASVLLLSACLSPIGSPRERLEGDRVVAIASSDDGTTVTVHAALLVAGHTWSDEAVELAWRETVDADEAATFPADAATTTGPLARFPSGTAQVGLLATFPGGTVRRAVLDLPSAGVPPTFGALSLADVPDQPLEVGTEDELALDTRRGVATQPTDHAIPGAWTRIQVTLLDATDRAKVRWTAARGRFLELDALTTDWAAAEVELDDLEVLSTEPLAPGPVPFVLLAIDEQGHNAFVGADVHVGAPGEGAWVGRRWLPADATVPNADRVAGVFSADDDAPFGLGLSAPRATTEEPTTAWPCDPSATGPFDPDWLLDGRCLRTDLDGLAVTLSVRP